MDNQLDKSHSVAHRYGQLESTRFTFLERARRAAELTIPTLVPKEGHSSSTVYPQPFQSVGARGVNNLASKLMLALFPPNSPFFRLTVSESDLGGIDKSQHGKVDAALARIERNIMSDLESQAARVPIFEALKQLIVAGNVLLYSPLDKSGMRVFRLDRYVVKRDVMGNPLEIIIKEDVSPLMLPDEVRALLTDPLDKGDKSYSLFTCVKRTPKKWETYQEIEGIKIPDSEGVYPLDKCPYQALRLTRIDGEDYGRGFVEEYIGDLSSLEGLQQAIVEGSAAAAKVLFLVRPNGTTKIRTIANSPNGAIVQGDKNDVSVLQLEKYNDFRVAQETAATITDRLSFAFMLNSAVQRNADRVTAEEVRFMAQELETSLGGVYSILSQELQLPLIKILLFRMEKQKRMPVFPKDVVKPQIVTGMEALGRGQDLNKLAQFLKFLEPLGPQVIAQELNINDYIDRLGASLGLETNGLVKSPEQKQAELQAAQQAQQAQMMQESMKNIAEKSAPEMINRGMENVDPTAVTQMISQLQGR